MCVRDRKRGRIAFQQALTMRALVLFASYTLLCEARFQSFVSSPSVRRFAWGGAGVSPRTAGLRNHRYQNSLPFRSVCKAAEDGEVHVHHKGKTTRLHRVRLRVKPGEVDMASAYQQLVKEFSISNGQVVSGFVLDPEGGGPICPFRLWEGLKGGEHCSLITCDTEVPPYMLPLPPKTLDPHLVSEATVSWVDLVSKNVEQRDQAVRVLVQGLEKQGIAFIRVTKEQQVTWDRAVESALHFFALPEEEKLACRQELCSGKFVGYLCQPKREFFQLRTVDHAASFPWPTRDVVEQSGGVQGSVSRDFAECYQMLDGMSRHVLKLMCAPLGLDQDEVIGMLDHTEGLHMGSGQQQGNREIVHVGADVFRIYQLFRPEGSPLPGLRDAGTGIHADLGMITIAPTASVPGLTLLSQDCLQWIDVESSEENLTDGTDQESCGRFVVFTGETLARLTKGRLRAPLHYVDETVMGVRRISAPFFLRARPEATLAPLSGTQHEGVRNVAGLMEEVLLTQRPWVKVAKTSWQDSLRGFAEGLGVIEKAKKRCDY